MKKYNYFDDDEEIQESEKENYNFSSILSKMNKENEENEALEPPKPSVSETEEIKRVVAESEESDKEELIDAIKAFSHKSGDKFIAAARAIVQSNPLEELENANKSKRVIVSCLMMVLVVIIFAGMIGIFMLSMNKENERISDFNQKAGKVCSDCIVKYGNPNYENLYNAYGVKGARLIGLCFARELDFNDDGHSELMITYNKNGIYYNEVWGYNSEDEFAVLFSEKAAQSESKAKDAWSTLYHKNNKYYIAVFDEKDLNKFDLYSMRGDKFSKKYSCTYTPKTEEYTVNGKDDTPEFEKIKYSVFSNEKASVEADLVSKVVEGFSGTAEVIAKPDGSQSIKNAYYSVIEEYNSRYGKAKYVEKDGLAYLEGLAVVRLIDFDNDGQNELLLVYRKTVKQRKENSRGDYITIAVEKYFCDIYRYSGSKAVLAYSGEGISSMLNDSSDRYFIIRHKDKKASYCVNTFNVSNYGRYINAVSSAYSFNGTEFKQYYKASYVKQYGYTEYYLDGEETYLSRFRENGYKLPFFNGDENDKYNTGEFEVTFVQRKSKNAASITGEISKTVKEIQKLNQLYVGDEE